MIRLAALQLPTLSMSGARIEYYLKYVKEQGAKLALLSEYNLNSFFTELIKMPRSMIKEQILHKKQLFLELSNKFELLIVAPIIIEEEGDLLKGVMKFDGKKATFYPQNILINYPHWDEASFFANYAKFQEVKIPIFSFEGFKFGVIFGYEAHFDSLFHTIIKEEVDCILMPTASTFDSNLRWQELLKMRAFLTNSYLLRVNRVGKTKLEDSSIEFYGDSFLISPFGKIEDYLGEKEGALVVELNKKSIKEARELWKFRSNLEKRELI